MERTINHRMVEIGRMARGYTQGELASLINLSQPNLSKIEKGLLTISPQILERLANALNYPETFFYQEDLRTPISHIYFRKRSTIPQKVLDKVFADIKLILKGIDNLIENVEFKEYRRYSFDITDGWTPESVAIRMREYLKIPSGPIKNLIKTVEEQGIIVYQYDSPIEKFDGLTGYTDKGIPVIFVNKNLSNDRIAFTVAHELGHLVMHIPCEVEPWRDSEAETNKFAAEFLMPQRDCQGDLVALSYLNLASLKAYWGTSKAMIIRRAKDLSAITESTYQYLMVELGRRNERKVEGGFVHLDEPLVLKEVVRLLKEEGNWTQEDIASSLHLHDSDYVKYFDNTHSLRVKVRAIRQAI